MAVVKIKRRLLLEPSEKAWECNGVLNPTTIKKNNTIHMIYRAVAKNFTSSFGYAKIENGEIFREEEPLLTPTRKYEKKGIEDPRISKIGSTYYLLYTAFDGRNARIAYATSKNLKNWKKEGIISPNISVEKARELVKNKIYRDKWRHQEVYYPTTSLWDKDAVLFPEKIKGKFVILHRFLPDIQIVRFKKFSELQKKDFWKSYIQDMAEDDKVSLYRRYDWEDEHIGAGCVPIKTKYGWLTIYHAVERLKRKSSYRRMLFKATGIFKKLREKRLNLIYRAGVALLDLKDPRKEITRLKRPLFEPKYKWEKQGYINNVVFPEGAILEKNNLKIYYGCSDSRIGIAELDFRKLIKKLLTSY
jgi:predicted GH43/DUF377 family glycosyl hydrolase